MTRRLEPEQVNWTAVERVGAVVIDSDGNVLVPPVESPVPIETAVESGKKLRAGPGRPPKGEDENVDNVNNRSPSESGGTSREYTVARLERDRPELAGGELATVASSTKQLLLID